MRTYAFIDASNLFYGGEKSLGWKIDYAKLFSYLEGKYGADKVYYFGGVASQGQLRCGNDVPLDERPKQP